MSDYWRDCLAESFERVGLAASHGQFADIVIDVEGAFEVYDEAHGYDRIPNPMQTEIDTLTEALVLAKTAHVCNNCGGTGLVFDYDCVVCGGNGVAYHT